MCPDENYIDRNNGARLGVYTLTALENFTKYLNPQECGNRIGVRYVNVYEENGAGLNLPFQRKSSKRTDMKSVRTISVPQMITNETVAENIQEKIKDGLSKRLDHHLEQMAKK